MLVLVSNCPQINNPCNGFDPTPVRIVVTGALSAAMLESVLVANRGEIARRIIATLRRTGVRSRRRLLRRRPGVAPRARGRRGGAPRPGPGGRELPRRRRASSTRRRAPGAAGVHPGYGFLSENAGFAAAVEAAGLAFIGPTPDAARAVRREAHGPRRWPTAAGVPLLPGTGLLDDADEAVAAAERDRLPGDAQEHRRRRRHRHAGLPRRRRAAPARSTACGGSARRRFGVGGVFLERLVTPRPPRRGADLRRRRGARSSTLGDRDCSLQRRNQKVVEETPAARALDEAAMDELARHAPSRWPSRSATARPAPSSSCTTPTAARPRSSRSTPACRSSTRSPRRSSASTWSSGWCGWPAATRSMLGRAEPHALAATPSRSGSTPRIPRAATGPTPAC